MRRTLGALASVILTTAFSLVLMAPQPALGAGLGFHAGWVSQDPWPTLSAGATVTYTFRYRNTGTETWQKGVAGRQVNLGTAGDSKAFYDQGMAVNWLAPDRLATTTEATVLPGAYATFTFTLKAPSGQGSYVVGVHPVLEGVTYLEDEGAYLLLVVDSGFHSSWVSESAWPTLDPGATSTPLTITFKNTGSKSWVKGGATQLNLGINLDDRSQYFLNAGWPSPDRVAFQNEPNVTPGSNVSFTFQMKAPTTPGVYQLHLRPVIDGVTWLEDEGVYMAIAVRGTSAPTLSASILRSGLSSPWDIAFAPDGRMFVTERVGNILVFSSGAPGAPQIANNPVALVSSQGEGGLMGIALDPTFPTNGFVYVCVTRNDGAFVNQVLRYKIAGPESGSALLFDGYVIKDGIQAAGNHDGCRIRFGPDGKLWVTTGEAGNPPLAQNPNGLNGKVLRVNGDGTIPADNPIMPGASGRSAVYSMGHRNPQGLAFQPSTGLPFVIEHSHYVNHTTNVSSHATVMRIQAGGNYSWPYGSGPGYQTPVWESQNNPYVATSGGAFVNNPAWGAWAGNLFVGALSGSRLLRLVPNPDGSFSTADSLYVNTYGRLRGPTEGPDGALYVTGDNGIILKVTPR